MKTKAVSGLLILFQLSLQADESPLSPEQALASFRLEPGLRVELVAAEPTVVDPVALAFDETGRLFVAENRGYPTGPGDGKPPAGIIAMLEDIDDDGHFEKRTVFADGLTFPNGVMPWKGGLFVTCAPDVLYLKDTDGDGRADVRRVVLTGFDASNTSQLRVSHPTLGIDKWVYLTSGLTGGRITSPDFPERAPVVLKSDSRFRPDTGEFEAIDGRAQFGQTFDDFGRRFICMNRVQVQHVVLPSRYLRRNPYLGFSESVENCPEAKNLVASALHTPNAATRIYPISHNITTADSHAGTFTAACGVLIYRGTALPTEYYGNAFSCDPTGNLVHRDQLVPNGATFVAQRTRDGVEFLVSTDDWFRPVFLANGPDGGLYICDMYRKTIEHPKYLPEEIQKRTDFDSGKDRGRIYRVIAERRPGGNSRAPKEPRRPVLFPPSVGIAQLCGALSDPNSWQRETAQRLLLERHDKSAVPLLRAALADGQSPIAKFAPARLQALRTLEGLGALDDVLIRQALDDPHPGVREQGIQMAEPRLAASPELFDRGLALADDPDARVRFQCALSLGQSDNPPTRSALAKISWQDAGDRWASAAVLSSVSVTAAAAQLDSFLNALAQWSSTHSDRMLLFFEDLGRIRGGGSRPGVFTELKRILDSNARFDFSQTAALLSGFAEGLRNSGWSHTNMSVLDSVFAFDSDSRQPSRQQFNELCRRAIRVAGSEKESLEKRLVSIRLLTEADFALAGEALLALLNSTEPAAIQSAAIRSLSEMTGAPLASTLLARERWQYFTPSLRGTVLAVLLSQPQHLPALLSALEDGRLPKAALTPAQRNQLLKQRNESFRQRAEKLFKDMGVGNRQKVFEDYKSVLALRTDPQNGKAVFKKLCASCHRLDREGVPVGPDLFEIRNQTKEAILLHIIIPEYEIVPGYTSYDVETKDGRTLSGLIASETAASITLRRAQGEEESVLRNNVASMSSTGLSLMPQELEKNMSRQDLADLIAYLKGE